MKPPSRAVILAAFASAVSFLSFHLTAETLTYREVEGNDVATHVISIASDLEKLGPGFRVELTTTRAGAVVRQTFLTAADLSTLSWTFSDPARSIELTACRQGGAIVLTGHAKGKKVAREFSGAGPAWNQLFQMGLGTFVESGGESFQFRSIGTQGPGEMKIGKFTVTREGTEKIVLSGKELGAIHLRISLSGLLSIFWHGDYWYRPLDGRFLRYRGRNRPGGPQAVSELVEEKVDDTKNME
jgi:hypothetical protein